jgi:DNA-binding beta-propeller fold protein YncE
VRQAGRGRRGPAAAYGAVPPRPTLWGVKSAVAAVAAAAAVIAVAACSAGSHPAAGRSTPPAAASGGAGPPRSAPAAPVAVPARVPGCSTATAAGPALRTVSTPMEPVPGTPFGVAVTADGRWAFVSLPGSGTVGAYRVGGSALPSPVRQVNTGQQPLGETLTRDGRYLLAADDADGAVVISVSRAESGGPGALLGTLGRGIGGGAIEVAVTPDDRFAFVSLENNADIAVFNLQRALATGFGASDFVGTIPAGLAPVGLAVSPDGRWLYATSEVALGGRPSPGTQAPDAPLGGEGTLTVISVPRAETDPAGSVVSTVDAGCGPVRVITSADGSVVWVTARGSDRLLGFSAARLRTDPAQALIASVEVGEAPVGLALADDGTRIVVADSNRFDAPGAASSLAVVNVAAALTGRAALAGYLPAGGFPRQMALEPAGRTLLVTNFSSQQLEAVDVAGLP